MEAPERVGPYRILEKLGSGGMGDVFLGLHDETGQTAAIKVLSASLAREGGFVERFHREIDAMRKLDNPHIVRLFGSGVDGENCYYAMEHIPGETLTSLLRREKRLPWRQTVDFAVQICQALKSAHDNGIIHRDLKPSNLLVAEDGSIKLTDFGVAQVFASDRLTVTGGIIGTAEYMSPEQAQGKRATKQSDLYSLGALMYAMITGRTPFTGSTAVEVIQKHKFGLFDRPSLIVRDLPQRVEETICRLLEKDPAKRFPDALVLLRHLEQLLRRQDFAESGMTIAEPSSTPPDATTVATGRVSDEGERGPGAPGPATLMQGLMRAEIEEINRGHWLSSLFNTLFVQVAALLAIIAGGVWWFWPRDLPAQEKFNRGVVLMQREPGPEWLNARREFFEPLVAADPEAWTEKASPYLRQIELYELTRRSSGAKRGKSAAVQSETERLLHLALHYKEIGEFDKAERLLSAVQSLLAGEDQQSRVHQLAGELLGELKSDRARLDADRAELLRGTLDRARRLLSTEDDKSRKEGLDLCRTLVELYGDDVGAAEWVDEARRLIEGGIADHSE